MCSASSGSNKEGVEMTTLKPNTVYPLLIHGEDYGRCLYLYKRGAVNTTQEIRPMFYVIVLLDRERGLDLKFNDGEFNLKGGVLHLSRKVNNTWGSTLVASYLEERLEREPRLAKC